MKFQTILGSKTVLYVFSGSGARSCFFFALLFQKILKRLGKKRQKPSKKGSKYQKLCVILAWKRSKFWVTCRVILNYREIFEVLQKTKIYKSAKISICFKNKFKRNRITHSTKKLKKIQNFSTGVVCVNKCRLWWEPIRQHSN